MEHVHILLKPASGACDLRCRYCFYRDEMEHRRQGVCGCMSEATLERVIRAALYKTLPPEVGGFDLVFVARGRTPWCKSTQLEPVVRQLLAQAGLPSC